MSNGKVLVWVEPELAAEIEELNNGTTVDELVKKYIEKNELDIQAHIDALNENVIRYKGIMAEMRKSFKDAYGESAAKSYEVWEEFDRNDLSFKKIRDAKNVLAPVIADLKEINYLLKEINLHDLEQLVEILRVVNMMSDSTRELLSGVLSNSLRKRE